MAIDFGSALEFESGDVRLDFSVCEIDTDKFVVAYCDIDDGYAGKARVATVSDKTITWGAISEFTSSTPNNVLPGKRVGVCKLDTDKFVVVYAEDSLDDDGYARVGTVSGTTISWGTAKEFETGDTENPNCCQLATDKFAIVYNDEAAGDLGTVCVCTVSTDTITSGDPVAYEGFVRQNACCKLDTDKFVAVYRDNGDSDKIKGCVFTVSGTIPSPGAILEIGSGIVNELCVAQLDTDKFVLAWANDTDSAGYIEICTVSGTTITEGAQVDLNPTSNRISYPSIAKIDGTQFVVVYEDVSNSEKGTIRLCTFSGTTITLGDEEIFHDPVTQHQRTALISSNKIVVVYADDADVSNHGEGIVGDITSGWSGGDIGEVPIADIAKISGVALADILKVNGVA